MLSYILSQYGSRGAARSLAVVAMLACASLAQAGEAGRLMFVTGAVQAGGRAAVQGDAVQEGDELSTGKDGYAYMQTSDDGLLILRPSTRVRVVVYHIDQANPANTRVKLELLSGVARSVSGSGVKQARQNFRFNTPVAAIGVRGTDFTVFTDQETSNVTVMSGAVVVSGFSGACQPGGAGPCEHAASRELSAGQIGQMLQVHRGQAEPKLLSATATAPDNATPPRADEPATKGGGSTSAEPSLDPRKNLLLLQVAVAQLQPPETPEKPVLPVLPVLPPVVEVPVVEPVKMSEMVWGRWTAVLGQAANVDTAAQVAAGSERIASNSYYTIFRTAGAQAPVPQQGSVAFNLGQSEAFVLADANQVMTAAKLDNGFLQVDFGKASFATGFDLNSGGERYKMQATGGVSETGLLSGSAFYVNGTNMTVNGALGSSNNAAYIFSTRLDDKKRAYGITHWVR